MTYLSGLSTFVPELVSNEMFYKMFPLTRWTKKADGSAVRIPLTSEWLLSATGLHSRALALREVDGRAVATTSEEESICGVARQAVAMAGLTPRDIDAVVIVSATLRGSMFHDGWRTMWEQIGFKPECLPVHLSLGCSGLASGLSVSEALSHRYKNVLLVTSHFSSSVLSGDQGGMYTDESDKLLGITYSLFGDAVGAVVVSQNREARGPGPILRLQHLENTFSPHERLMFKSDVTGIFHMDGARVKTLYLPQLLCNLRTLTKQVNSGTGINAESLCPELGDVVRGKFSALLCHQANPRILQEAAGLLKLNSIELPISADVYGNTSAPGTLVLLHQQLGQRADLQKGARFAFSWVGAGLGMQRGNAIMELE